MANQNYLDDIRDIRQMMDRSTQFLSLSGLAGVMAGVYALIGVRFAARIIDYYTTEGLPLDQMAFNVICALAAGVFVLSVATALVLSHFKARKLNEKLWNASSRRLLSSFAVPFITGGVFSLLLVRQGLYELIAPATLLFYGLACVSASRFTRRDVQFLGMTMIALGLLATVFTTYGIVCWALGFGLSHIVYGAIMYFKYDRT